MPKSKQRQYAITLSPSADAKFLMLVDALKISKSSLVELLIHQADFATIQATQQANLTAVAKALARKAMLATYKQSVQGPNAKGNYTCKAGGISCTITPDAKGFKPICNNLSAATNNKHFPTLNDAIEAVFNDPQSGW